MPMYDPPHPGEMIRDILEDEEVTWSVTECAQRLDVARNTLSRLLNGRLVDKDAALVGCQRALLAWGPGPASPTARGG